MFDPNKGRMSTFLFWILKIVYNRGYADGYLGDIVEVYDNKCIKRGNSKAFFWLLSQVARSIPGMVLDKIKWSFTMLKNYFKIGLRNILNNKGYTFINVFSLSIGITCTILISLFINDEYSFDKFNKNYKNIYGLYAVLDFGGARATVDANALLAPELDAKFPEILDAVRVKDERLVFSYENKFFEENGLAVDPSFFDIFTTDFVSGNPENVLGMPRSIVLTRKIAKKYFETADPIGKTIQIKYEDDALDYIVTGIIENCKSYSSFQFDYLLNLPDLYRKSFAENGSNMKVPTFFLLSEGYDSELLEKRFGSTIDEEFKEDYGKESGYKIFPFADYHLTASRVTDALSKKSNEVYSQILLLIGALILILASFNYTNLSAGISFKRFKEIGLRKVLGARRIEVIKQFLFETTILTLVSFAIGILMSIVLLPTFNQITDKGLSALTLFEAKYIFFLIALAIVLILSAGGYPALLVSKITSLDLFRKQFSKLKGNSLSKILITVQFSISILFVIGSVFIYMQHNYMLTKELGYDKDKVVVINLKNITDDFQISKGFFNNYKNKLISHKEIRNVSGASYPLGNFWMATWAAKKDGGNEIVHYNYVDIDFVKALGLTVTQGQDFVSQEDSRDAVIVNELLIKDLNIASPIGTDLSDYFKKGLSGRIVGVVKDYHVEVLKFPIRPAYFKLKDDQSFAHIFVKFNSDNISNVLSILKDEFNSILPNIPFEYKFMNEVVEQQYSLEKQWSNIIKYSSLLSILIACLGLFGLSVLVVNQRTKEIGIRKVLGASELKIMNIVFREFGIWIIAANIIAWPIAHFSLSMWLESFAYTIELNYLVFVLSGGLIFLAAILSVSIQSYKAATANPVETLRYE